MRVKYKIENEIYVYATTLYDSVKYPTMCFGDLYHGRWGIEELYKVSKTHIDVEDFHSQTERGVKQEIYGHLLLVNLAKIFELDAQGMLPNDNKDEDYQIATGTETDSLSKGKSFKINFKNCLGIVALYLENLILAPKQLISSWLSKALKSIAKVRQRRRPGRSYPRISFKPRNRWTAFGAAARA